MTIKPDNQNNYNLLLTFMSQVSHHDPATTDKSNTLTFNRQKQLVMVDMPAYSLSSEQVAAFCTKNPIPTDIQSIFLQMSFVEFVAISFIRLIMDIYNSMDGVGIFSGLDRYEKLEDRVKIAAIRSFSLHGFWSRACDSLQLPIQSKMEDDDLLAFFALPSGLQQNVLSTIIKEHRAIVTLARVWHSQVRKSEQEIKKTKKEDIPCESIPMTMLEFKETLGVESQSMSVIDVPSISSNSLRHSIVRQPAWEHLVKALDITSAPPGIEAMFVNGGNICAGAKQPINVSQLSLMMRQAYPFFDLLGGVANSFDLGEGRLTVAGWVVCQENLDALAWTPAENLPMSKISIFDMLDDVTHTRQATEQGLGQMIWNFETMAKGLNVLVKLRLHPFTSDLTKSAFFTAVEQFRQSPTIGGQSARGFGWCNAEWLGNVDVDTQTYADYLTANCDRLREGIMSGELGTNMMVVS